MIMSAKELLTISFSINIAMIKYVIVKLWHYYAKKNVA